MKLYFSSLNKKRLYKYDPLAFSETVFFVFEQKEIIKLLSISFLRRCIFRLWTKRDYKKRRVKQTAISWRKVIAQVREDHIDDCVLFDRVFFIDSVQFWRKSFFVQSLLLHQCFVHILVYIIELGLYSIISIISW